MTEHIYVIDDQKVVRTLLKNILESQHFQVSEYDNANTALNTLISTPATELPQLILSDVQMPQMRGFELCQRLKQHETLKEVPVIFVSGKDDYKEIAEGLETGAVDYITKPFQPQVLLARISVHDKK